MESLVEALFNVVVGYGINFIGNLVILPMLGYNVTIADNLVIGLFFTVVSVARSYALRRWFNAGIRNGIHNMVTRFRASLGG